MRIVRALRHLRTFFLLSTSSLSSRALPMRKFLTSTAGKAVAPSAPTAAKASSSTAAAAAVAVSSSVGASPAETAPHTQSQSQSHTHSQSSAASQALLASAESLSAAGLDVSLASQAVRGSLRWAAGESVPYSSVVLTLEEIAGISGRIEKENSLARLFTAILCTTPADLESAVYLASNEVSPAYEGLELGVGDSLLVKAICEATGRKKDAVEEAYAREGDLGIVALQSRSAQKTLGFAAKPKPLLASQVLTQFRQLAQIKGEKAQARKVEAMKALLTRCQGAEAKYIVRALQGKLRIGLASQTVLVALAHAVVDLQARSNRHKQQQSESVSESGSEGEEEDDVIEDSDAESSPKKKKKSKAQAKKSKSSSSSETQTQTHTETESSLAHTTHAPLTEEEESSLSLPELLSRVTDRETPEAHALRAHYEGSRTLTKEQLYEYAEMAVKRAFSECPNLSLLVQALTTHPIHELYKQCRLQLGVPVSPMLAKPTKEVGEVLKRLCGQAFTMEYKYDGERAQVHLLADGSVKIFSRNSEDNTEKYRDLQDVVRTAHTPEVVSCIVDAEVVAFDREKNVLLPFQVLSTRKRKIETAETTATLDGAAVDLQDQQKVKVVLQLFDLLHVNGQSLLRESLRTRRAILRKAFQAQEQRLFFASGSDHVEDGDTAPIEVFLSEACGAFCEGLMVKTLDAHATYEPAKRSLNWLKLKKDYLTGTGLGVCDSVDLVPIGGYYGRGKRTNVYGAYLMACYDPERDEFQSVCKVGTGFKDEDLQRLTQTMRTHILPGKQKPVNYDVGDALFPDDWFSAGRVVWELQAADLSRSSVHRGGVGRVDRNTSRGIGLRFPRFLRERDDKKAEQATTSEQIVDMFLSQSNGNAAEDAPADSDNDEFI